MTETVYENYIPNLIDSMLSNLGVSSNNLIVIKHYNTFDLSQTDILSLAKTRKQAAFWYHSFNAGDMLEAYEPFLYWIKQLYYEFPDESIDIFLEQNEVYLSIVQFLSRILRLEYVQEKKKCLSARLNLNRSIL